MSILSSGDVTPDERLRDVEELVASFAIWNVIEPLVAMSLPQLGIERTRDNFFEFTGRTYMPYVQSDVYGAYNATDQAFYFAWEVKEQSSSDVLEVMFSDPSDTTITDQIRFDKAGQFLFYVFEDTGIHPRFQ